MKAVAKTQAFEVLMVIRNRIAHEKQLETFEVLSQIESLVNANLWEIEEDSKGWLDEVMRMRGDYIREESALSYRTLLLICMDVFITGYLAGRINLFDDNESEVNNG